MKTSIESVSGVEKRIRVEVPADEVSQRVEAGYAKVRKVAPLRGFRKGEAPMSMVRRVFKEAVETDVAEDLVRNSLSEAVKENSLKILSLPKIDGAKLTEGEEFVFTATVEVVPEVTPEGYRGIPIAEGGVPVGKEFESHLSGVRPGEEKTFEVRFEPDFPNRKYAGKQVVFEVKVNGVREKKLPEMDDEFAKGFGDIDGLSDLREKIRVRLVQEAKEAARGGMEEQIRQGLLEKNSFEVPKTLVDREIVSMIEDTASRLVSQGIDLKKESLDFEKMKKRFAPTAERAGRLSLLLAVIAEKE